MSPKKRPVFESSVSPYFSIFYLDIASLYGLYVKKSEYKRNLSESENSGNIDHLVLGEKNGLFIWIFKEFMKRRQNKTCMLWPSNMTIGLLTVFNQELHRCQWRITNRLVSRVVTFLLKTFYMSCRYRADIVHSHCHFLFLHFICNMLCSFH